MADNHSETRLAVLQFGKYDQTWVSDSSLAPAFPVCMRVTFFFFFARKLLKKIPPDLQERLWGLTWKVEDQLNGAQRPCGP